MTKTCSKCKRSLPLTTEFFGINRSMKSGLKSPCKECEKSGRRLPYGYTSTPEAKLEYDRERFESMVAKSSGCWLWIGSQSDDGYGRFNSRLFSNRYRAHRFAWFLRHGQFPADGLVVCHACDTPLCVNPDHLWLGTNAENILDMWHKGRANPGRPQGEANGTSKLTDDDVIQIRRDYRNGLGCRMGREYGVSAQVIHAVVTRKTWRHIEDQK